MGRTLLRPHVRRRNRRRSLPYRRFCSCCCEDIKTVISCQKSRSNCLSRSKKFVKQKGSGRAFRGTKKASTVQVKLGKNGQKTAKLNLGCTTRTSSIDVQLKKVIVNVTRLRKDVLGVLMEIGSICVCEVDSGVGCSCSTTFKSLKRPCSSALPRVLRSTTIQPVDRHVRHSVMDKLRGLNADWRSSIYPLSNNCYPSFASKNIPLPELNMKTLFLENLSICKALNDEGVKENVKVPQNENGRRPCHNSQQLMEKIDSIQSKGKVQFVHPTQWVKMLPSIPTSLKTDSKSAFKSMTPSQVPRMRQPVTTRPRTPRIDSCSKAQKDSPSDIQTPFQSLSPRKWNRRPTILGAKSNVDGKCKLPFSEKILTSASRDENAKVNCRKRSLTMTPAITASKPRPYINRAVTLSTKRATRPDIPLNGISSNPLGLDHSGSTPKKQKIQCLQDSAKDPEPTISTPQHCGAPAAKKSPKQNYVYTIVLSDSSDDDYIPAKKVAPPKPAVGKINTVEKNNIKKCTLVTKITQRKTKANCLTRKKSSDSISCGNNNHSDLQVAVKKAPRTRKSPRKIKSETNRQPCASESDAYNRSDSGELSKFVENPIRMKRTRGNGSRSCRSCPGCQIDAPRQQKPKQVPVQRNVRSKLKSYSSGCDGFKDNVNITPRKDTGPLLEPESSPPVVIHGSASSGDSLDCVNDQKVLGGTALVVETNPPCIEFLERETPLPVRSISGSPINTIPKPDVEGSSVRQCVPVLPNIHFPDVTTQNPRVVDCLLKTNDPINLSSQNVEVEQLSGCGHETNFGLSVPGCTESPFSLVSSGNAKCSEIQRSNSNVEIICQNVDYTMCIPNDASGVKDKSVQDSIKRNNPCGNISTRGIDMASDVKLSNGVCRSESKCNEPFWDGGTVPSVAEFPSCEPLNSSITVENLDFHDYSESDGSCCRKCLSEEGFHQTIDQVETCAPNFSFPECASNLSGDGDVLNESKDPKTTNDCGLLKYSGFENTDDKASSVVANRPTSVGRHIAFGMVENLLKPTTSRFLIPAPDIIQTLQSKVMSDESFFGVSCGPDDLNTQGDETSRDNHVFVVQGNVCEAPTSNHPLNVLPTSRDSPILENGSSSQVGDSVHEGLDRVCESNGSASCTDVLRDEVVEKVTPNSHYSLLESSPSNFEVSHPPMVSTEFFSAESSSVQNGVPDMISVDQNCEMQVSNSDGVPKDMDKSEEVSSLGIDHLNDYSLATTSGEQGDSSLNNQAPPENQSGSEEAMLISHELSHLLNDCLNDLVESVKLAKREVIIRKVNLKSSEKMDSSAATTELQSIEESESLFKELNILVPLNPQLMIKKIPMLREESGALSEVNSSDSKSRDSMSQDAENANPNDHQVPQNAQRSTLNMTTPTKSLYDRRGYPTPIKKLNPSVLSVIKYSELEIDNDEPSLNDPPETDLIECLSSRGIRCALNPEDLSAIEYFLNKKSTPVVDRPEMQSSVCTKADTDFYCSLNDLIIDNDEPPLNQSPMKPGKRPQLLFENEEDLDDLVIDNDAPPLNESAGVKADLNDCDCLIISSDDEVVPSVADSQLGKTSEIRIPPIAPIQLLPRPRKKLLRKRRDSASILSSECHNKESLMSQRQLLVVNPADRLSVVNQKVSDLGELESPHDSIIRKVVVNDCGNKTQFQAYGKPLLPFQSLKTRLNDYENPVLISTVHTKGDLCSSQQELRGQVTPESGSVNQLLFDIDNMEFSGSEFVDEIVVDGSGTESVSQPSWKPRPQFRGCQETLLQPQVFNLLGQPLKLDDEPFRDSGQRCLNIASSLGNPAAASQVAIYTSETKDDSKAECVDIYDSDTATVSEGDAWVSPPRVQPHSTAKRNLNVYNNGCDTEDLSYLSVSDSDDDVIVVSEPESFAAVNKRTLNSEQPTINTPVDCVNLCSPTSRFKASRSEVLPTSLLGSQVRAVPIANGNFYYALVLPPNRRQLFPS